MKWYKSESTIRPDEVDTTSSKTSVYLRRNIVEKQRESEIDGEMQMYYEYEEAKLTKEEYEKYKQNPENKEIEQLRSEVDMLTECLLEMSQLLYG